MRVKFVSVIVGLVCIGFSSAFAQSAAPVKFKNPYYDVRLKAHEREGLTKGAIVFLGNSITEQGWWNMLIGNKFGVIENRGIGGDNTFGMIDRLPLILESQPRKIFLMAGINDLTANRSIDTIVYNITRIVEMTKAAAPNCEFYIQSVLPVNDEELAYPAIKGKNPQVRELNRRLEKLCKNSGITFVDLVPVFADPKGELRTELTKDGIHLHPAGYQIWVDYLLKNKYLK